MAFTWKEPNKIWKGEGIYHLTFVVAGRRPLLGELVPLAESSTYKGSEGPNRLYVGNVARFQNTDVLPYEGWRKELCMTELATVRLSAFGLAVNRDLKALPQRYAYAATDEEPAIIICGKQFMENHLHVVIWVKRDVGKSIRQIAQGFRIGVRGIANEMGLWKQEDGHVFEVPFIRTLSHKGQLSKMLRYVHANPDASWRMKMNPDMYVIRRHQEYSGLMFDTMGKSRLLDYPDTQVIALSRSLSEEQVAVEVEKALKKAERGAVTYTAAINEGERAVAKAVRAAGFPLVVMLLDGFPPAGSEAERFYKPGGAYHKACGEGRLLLLAPHASNYENPELIAKTEQELARKAAAKGHRYTPLPHTSTRWRMIAGNVMLDLVGGQKNS